MCYHAFWAKNQAQTGPHSKLQNFAQVRMRPFCCVFFQNWDRSLVFQNRILSVRRYIYIYIYISILVGLPSRCFPVWKGWTTFSGWFSLHFDGPFDGPVRCDTPHDQLKRQRWCSAQAGDPGRIQILGVFCPHSDVCCFIKPIEYRYIHCTIHHSYIVNLVINQLSYVFQEFSRWL